MRISKFNVKKALLDHLVSVAGGITVIPEGSDEQSTVGEDSLKESTLFGPNNITVDANGRDNMQGIYQVGVCTPVEKADFYNANLCDVVINSFGKGRSANIEHNGQWVEIQNIDVSDMMKNEANTHIMRYISVNFRAV